MEAVKSASSAAISSNEKIFPVFAKKLASRDMEEFIHTAHKLAVWLGSEKAYYPAARPKIVWLLEIARSTFIDAFMRHPGVRVPAERLQELIGAVIPFKHLFPESELQSRLQRAIFDTNLSLSLVAPGATQGNVQLQGFVATDILLPQPAGPVVPEPMSQMQPPSSVHAVPNGSIHADIPQVPNRPQATSSGHVPAIQSLVHPVMNTPQDGENISPIIPSKPQPKRARRAELPEDLIARDLDWFKSQQVQGSAAVSEDPSASSKASESSLALASDTPHNPQSSPSLKKKTARMVPSRRLPRRAPLEASQEAESGASASALPPDSELSPVMATSFENAEYACAQTDVDERKPFLEKTETPAHSTEIPEHSSVPLHEATLDSTEPMDISCSNLDSENPASEPPGKVESTPPQSSEVSQFGASLLPSLVSALELPLSLDFKLSQVPATQPQQVGVDTNRRRFDGKMAVIHSAQGKPFTHTHMIDINLNENIFSKISKWVNRKSHSSEAPQGVCISLACYRLRELFNTVKSESGKYAIEELTSRSSCSWPCSNRLSLHVNDDERQTIITLYPPLFLTPDQCVDISSLMKPGNNTLEIKQQDDLSEYLVVLHAHLPTRAQLAELEVVNSADERWKRFLDVLSARVLPEKMYETAPVAGVVGLF